MAERGRPRAFDRNEALHRAMHLFWTRGYEGASVSDLAEVMGINKPSLYAAFGCKEELFRAAISLYEKEEGAPVGEALEAGRTARCAIEAALRSNARNLSNPDNPRGCMLVVAALAGPAEDNPVCRFLSDNRRRSTQNFRRRVARGIAEGDVPATADPDRIAAFYTAVLHGLSIQARDGAAAETLEHVVDCAMAAWEALAR